MLLVCIQCQAALPADSTPACATTLTNLRPDGLGGCAALGGARGAGLRSVRTQGWAWGPQVVLRPIGDRVHHSLATQGAFCCN